MRTTAQRSRSLPGRDGFHSVPNPASSNQGCRRLRPCRILLLLLLAGGGFVAQAQLQLVADQEPQRVFAGDARKITLIWRNTGRNPVSRELHARLFQASSATAAPFEEVSWKRLEILPGQTVLESATLSFPAVRAETRFLVQWVEGTNDVVGTTEVLVHPVDLLKELKPLADDEPLGVLDPQNQLKPLLKSNGVEFLDLEETALGDFSGKLAILGPFLSKARAGLAGEIKAVAGRGVGVVWIQPPPELRETLKPTFYALTEGKGAVVVAQAALVANLAENPQAQLNLIQLSRLALRPEPPRLPAE